MSYETLPTDLPEVFIVKPSVYHDKRGYFFESYNQADFTASFGPSYTFVQDNHSRSLKGVLRGLHYQLTRPQGKLVRVVEGEIYDVVVDIRIGSPTFGQWTGSILNEKNKHFLWVPPGYAHGLLVMSEKAHVIYKTTDYYCPVDERCIRWDDPKLSINWPLNGEAPLLSEKDAMGTEMEFSELPSVT